MSYVQAKDGRLDAHLTLYCPFHQEGKSGWHSHRHAAHTALAFDLIEPWLPALLGEDSAPFVSRRHAGVSVDPTAQVATDSLINAAAAHHKPDTFLQWIIATADRVASGFEREEFDRYNHAKDERSGGLDHYTARQITLFEQMRLDGSEPAEASLQWRYPLRTLSPASLFPVPAKQCERRDREAAKTEYAKVWHWFLEGRREVPVAHRQQLPLWFDHFDSVWMAATHAIPAATAFNVKPEVSLYDHSRARLRRWQVIASKLADFG